MKEIWVDIVGYKNKYQVSNTGKVRSLNYNRMGIVKELKQKINRFGFCEVRLSKNNKFENFMVARLVAQHFLPNPQLKDEAMHISRDKLDNSVNNLKWAYKSETRHHMYNKGSRKKGNPTYTKITYNGKNYKTYTDIAKDYGIVPRTFYKRYVELKWGLDEAILTPVGKGR